MKKTTHRFLLALVLSALTLLVLVTLVWAYAEEPLSFRDPYTGALTDEEINTIHFDLTYPLALAAGFSVEDSKQLQIWNQLVDSEQIGPGAAISYTNCTGAFYPSPVPTDVCPAGTDPSLVAWPLWANVKGPSCFTSRFGPYMPFFHFPHQNARDLGALYDWGWGFTDTLVGYEAYAWGGHSVMSATCLYTRTVVITTGMEAGSLPAFAIYLHSLADYYSHRECIAVMDGLDMPWATHTIKNVNDIPECNYNPYAPNNLDAHGREYGTSSPADSQRTDAAIRAVYGELASRSLQREGVYFPLSLDTVITGNLTLSDTLYAFVHNWGFKPAGPGPDESEYAQNRRNYAKMIADAVLASPRQPIRRVYLPLVIKNGP
jgi:hypothetical protein